MEKKSLFRLRALAEKLRALPQLDGAERILFAQSLLASPQERWDRHENFLRSQNLFSYSEQKKSGFSLPE